MLKVAIVCGAGIVSGKEIMALELAKGLRDKGCEVEIITSCWGNGDFRRRLEDENFPAHVMRLGFISATLNFECMRMTAHQMLFWPKLLMDYYHFLKTVRPGKVVHTNWHHLILLCPFLRPGRDIYWSHEITPTKPQYRCLFLALANRVGCFVAVSRAAAQSLLRLGVPKDKVVVIYNGIDDPAPVDAAMPDNAVLIIAIVGQIGAWKGHEDLLMAFRDVLKTHPTTQLHIFGRQGSKYETFLRKRANELEIEQKVVWRGFVEDISQIYRDPSVVSVPTKYVEPFGLTAIEAAFFRVPVVASRKGGLPEIIADDETGLLFESGDIGQLAQHLTRLLADPELRNKMGRKARERAMSLFSRDRFIGDFFRLLEAA